MAENGKGELIKKQDSSKKIVVVKKKVKKVPLRVGPYIVRNCDRGLENAAQDRRPRAAFSNELQ